MTKDTKTLVSDKVRKLLRLSKSSNEHEAALAAQKASELLSQSGMVLTDIEIEQSTIKENRIKTKYKKTPKWVYQLGSVVANNTYCRIFLGNSHVNFIGGVQDAEVAGYLFEYLYKTVKAMTKAYTKSFYGVVPLSKTISISYSYASGVVATIAIKLKSLLQKDEPVVTASGTELMVVKGAVVADYINKNKKRTNPVNINSRVNFNHFDNGVNDGLQVSVHRAVEKSNTKGQQRLK